MKCCIVGSWKVWKHVDISFGVFECEVSPDSRQKCSDHSLCDGRFCFVILRRWKSEFWKSLLANSRPRFVYKNNVFSPPLFRIFAKYLRIDSPDLFFSGSAHAKFENFSTTINMNVWPSLNIFAFGKSIKSACHWSSTPLTTVRQRWKLRRTSRCKECRDAQSVDGECV